MFQGPFSISQLAIPAVWVLITFLTFTSQYFFLHFEAVPLRENELWAINILAACIGICYYRSCTVDPGHVPKDWKQVEAEGVGGRQRWCRKCEAFKPPRTHHCRTCGRCIPKMDHHCPWTTNCVSHFTFPHFVRFLFYAVVGMSYLESCLFERASTIWASRHLPSYLGPSLGQMAHLFILLVVNSLTVFALFILLVRGLWSLGGNTTTIESWEIERHKTLLRRARHFGGCLDAPGGVKIHIRKQEFPYDIGIWDNIKAGMGGNANVLSWLWPFAATPDRESGLDFEINGFEGPNTTWPPPDPDRIPLPTPTDRGNAFTVPQVYSSAHEEIEAFNRRRDEDLKRARPGVVQRRKRFHERFDPEDRDESDSEPDEQRNSDGEEAWRNSEGERLHDFGVDEEIEFYDEEDIPLAVLMQQRGHRQQ
ncbi:putative palmitoyltransferase with autoacylation activity Pfa4 [Aspergillus glaucus CBS 516.65]|uniref:Palmitoyltransferase PFA4 n=1 Tax=Aspergillus glaucus CBS 516.65 TaxID=1160497 RepID=A0A1L9VL74_ASPGL|nr:hypothetical protein ASPGLDRAFT_125699 [Aspergillus glaucus CBS 516.65]OJJ84632.1 hypothetical protein ASPGLDRAFT_125699 [Aspergillus glaucus CBS 516.65]